MKSNNEPIFFKILFTFSLCVCLTQFSFSQTTDSTKANYHFSGSASVTNNGISVIPTFTLGKPAFVFDMSAGNKKLSFEPQFRFASDGKPWGFIFWGRYKAIENDKFSFTVGAHPGISFKTLTAVTNGVTTTTLEPQRFLAGELTLNYFLTKNISVGTYYLVAHGFEDDATKTTHFITLNSSISHIKLSNQFFLSITPQVYYLKLDDVDGFYFTGSVTLSKKNFPFSVSGLINKVIRTNIPSKDFLWNATLTYSFGKNYIKL